MSTLETLAVIAGIVGAFAGIPQIIKIFQRKSAKDISAVTYTVVFFGAIIWILYGWELKNLPLLLSNSIGIIITTTILVGWYLYGREK